MRLRAEIWVQAYMRRAQAEGSAAYVVRRGDPNAGAILICIAGAAGTSLFTPVPADEPDGERAWRERVAAAPESAAEVARHVERETSFDPDVWVIEIEDRDNRHFLGDRLKSEPDRTAGA
jgi:hypothetical protein